MVNNAWRKACKLWLLKKHAVKIIKGEKMLPGTSQKGGRLFSRVTQDKLANTNH